MQLLKCRQPEVLIEGPSGTGKSRAVLEKINAFAMRYPGSRYLITRASRASMSETVLVTFEKIVLAGQPHIADGPLRYCRQSYRYPNGSEVVTGGMDNADRIMSGEFDMAAAFEATEFAEDDIEKIITRLRWKATPYRQLMMDCNPGAPSHWLNQRAKRGGVVRLLSRHEDNPSIDPKYLVALSRLTGVRRLRLFDGKWAGSEGVVYDRFDPAVHVRPCPFLPARVIVGVDDGYTNPFAAVLLLVDGDGRIHVAGEVYRKGLSESGKIEAVRELADGYTLDRIACDPAAAGLIGAMESAGLPVDGANNDVVTGINRVQERFEVQGDGRPRLTIGPECTSLVSELEGYEWLPDKPKDTPRKVNDHACDALRYGTMAAETVEFGALVDRAGSRPVRTVEASELLAARAAAARRWDNGEDLEP